MSQALPFHTPCGRAGIGEQDVDGVVVCVTQRRWCTDADVRIRLVEELGCGRKFPLCADHEARACTICHTGNDVDAGARGLLRAIVLRGVLEHQLARDVARVLYAEIDAAADADLMALAVDVERLLAPSSQLGRAVRAVAVELAGSPS